MMPAVAGDSAASSAAISTSPSGSEAISRTFMPHMRRGRRIRAVRGIRHDDLVPRLVAARAMIGADHRNAGELALRAGHRRQRHAGHAGDVLAASPATRTGRPMQALARRSPARADAGRGIPAASPANCRPAGCTSSCRSRAGRSACRCRNSSATAACSGARPAVPRPPAVRRRAAAPELRQVSRPRPAADAARSRRARCATARRSGVPGCFMTALLMPPPRGRAGRRGRAGIAFDVVAACGSRSRRPAARGRVPG